MRIIFFIGSLSGGGAEGVVATLTSRLSERGHHVTLITHLRNRKYEVSPNVNLIDKEAWQYDTRIGNFPLRIYKKIANRFLDFQNIKKTIDVEKPEVVISFLVNNLKQLLFLCKGRIPVISAERNAMVYPHSGHNFLNKQILYRMVDVVQVMSNYDKAWVRNKYAKVVPMPNPLRYPPLDLQTYNQLFEIRHNILACGRLDPQKGFDKLILAFASIADRYPEWNVDICGDDTTGGVYYQYIRRIIAEKELESRIHFLGFRKDINSVMQSHAVFCLSSQHEGFPNVLSEAMANGMACVSFDIVTGPSEIINDGLDGIIVDDQNIEELSDALSRVIEDKDLRYSLGVHAIENIKRYEQSTVVDRWEKMFNRVIRDYKRK